MDAWTTARTSARTRESEDELPTLVWRARDARRARMTVAEQKQLESGIRRAREALVVPSDWTPAKPLVAVPTALREPLSSPPSLAPSALVPSPAKGRRRGRSLLPLVTLLMAAGIAFGLSRDAGARAEVVRGLDAGWKTAATYVERLSVR